MDYNNIGATSIPLTFSSTSYTTDYINHIFYNNYTANITSEKITIKCNLPYQIKDVKEYVSNKVYEFTFNDDTKIKTICDEEDVFDLEYAFYLALAKKLYSETYTFEGVIHKSYELQYEKKYVKIVKNGIKLFKKIQEEKIKKEQEEELKKNQHKKYIEKKIKAKKRKEQNEINKIAKAIRLSKEEG